MPHAVYLHSGLTRDRGTAAGSPAAARADARRPAPTSGLAMLLAGAVNIAMLLLAASDLRAEGHRLHRGRARRGQRHARPDGRVVLRRRPAGVRPGIDVGRRLRRGDDHAGPAAPLVPAAAAQARHADPGAGVLAIGVDPSRALVLSQVVLSFGIPFALVPLVRLTADRTLMGDDVNHRVTTALGWTVAGIISVLNVVLIYLTVTG